MFNKVIIAGYLTRKPELRYTPNGTPVCTFGLAASRKYKQGDEMKQATTFIDVTVFGKKGETCEKYLDKGRPVIVEGTLEYNQWETEGGEKHSRHTITANSVTFLASGHKTTEPDQDPEMHPDMNPDMVGV